MTDTAVYWDPFDTEIDTMPYPTWKQMRDEAPVYYNERFDFYALSRHADVETAHRLPAIYSSNHGIVLEMMSPNKFDGGQMIMMDPPDHEALRTLVSRAFTPRRVAELESYIRATCNSLLDAVDGRDRFDFLQDYGALLPSMVISHLIGVPEVDREHTRRLIDEVFHIEPGVGMINDRSFMAQVQLHEYFAAQLIDRQQHPRDDMFTDLTVAEIDTPDGKRRLTVTEMSNFANLLVSAGTETVAKLLGWTALTLDEHPDQRAELAANSSLLANAVEELLRYEAPSPVQGRWTHQAVELHGITIPENCKVLLLTGAAGRDERRYPDPDRFDIHRDLKGHVSFGFGIHFCLGAALARMEGRVAIEEVLKRHPTFTVDRPNCRQVHTSTVRGFAEVPVFVGG